MAKMKLKPGVITGNALQDVFAYCKEVGCALPAVNVIGSSSINAALQAAREASSPIMIQFSNGGGVFNAGKYLDFHKMEKLELDYALFVPDKNRDGRYFCIFCGVSRNELITQWAPMPAHMHSACVRTYE